ncbi:hypothetical protein GALLR39Z86_32580 [Glycomyces algeriensis]|uniref:Uncharacterized protein n=1 Tax=Glycomyces algeriensis TaxID=256037 RepID=A0A9W6LH97_9ACTN|nr:hypothetical protein GALLR39Z86_32580 [Glycomyces algeriensis]
MDRVVAASTEAAVTLPGEHHAVPAVARVKAALAEPGRSDRLDAIADDEALQGTCQVLLAHL